MSVKIDTKSLADMQKMAQQKLDLISVYSAETSGIEGSAYGEAERTFLSWHIPLMIC